MAQIGDELMTPEVGWQRIDDNDTRIKYEGDYLICDDSVTQTTNYGGALHTSNDPNFKMTFYGVFTKFILINNSKPDQSDKHKLYIDDVFIETFNTLSPTFKSQICVLKKEGLTNEVHKVTIEKSNDRGYIGLDAIDINADGYLITEQEYNQLLLQEQAKQDFPIKIADDTIQGEDDIRDYAATLIEGERQLLIYDRKMYLTDGAGNVEKIVDSEDIDTSNILDKATYDTNNDGIVDKASIAKKIENIESAPLFSVYGKSPNGEMGFYEFPIGVINDETNKFQSVKQNVNENQIYTIDLTTTNKLNDLIVQVYEFTEGMQDVVTTLKEFNNKDANNFYYDKENVVFTDEGAKIKNEYEIISTKNEDTGFYELDLSQEGFISDISDISIEEVK